MENGKRQQLKTICRNQNEISKAQANRKNERNKTKAATATNNGAKMRIQR